MSFGTTLDATAMAALQGGKTTELTGKGSGNNPQLQAAFNTQMRMAMSLFGEGSQARGEGSTPGGFDDSFVGDALMFEALSTITRLMQTEAGLPLAKGAVQPQAMAQIQAQVQAATGGQQAPAVNLQDIMPEIGALSARFESGSSGVSTIGYDRVGGTSYGKYQIASKPGTMDRFLTFLDDKSPAWADRLRNAGPTNTGSKEGGMPAAWQEIAKENPALFEKMQHDFIAKETYNPARDMIFKKTGFDFDNAPPVLREVLWSTSVQHGPTGAAKIFGKVMDQFVGSVSKGNFNSKLIEGVYNTRKGQFGSSTSRVQAAVANRMDNEKQIALNMLGKMQINRVV